MKPQDYIDRLSTHLKQVIARAIGSATAMAHTEVTPVHLLFALSEETGSVGTSILQKLEITPELIRSVLDTMTPLRTRRTKPSATGGLTTALPELNIAAKQALEKAMLLAYEHEHNYIGTEHLLHGLRTIEHAQIQAVLDLAGVRHDALAKEIAISIDSTNKFPDIDDIAATLEEMQDIIESSTSPEEARNTLNTKKTKKQKQQSALETFSVELTNKHRQERIDPVIGRASEIERMVHILARRNKNNPVLVGEPGVGKTAIVEGLAKRIIEGDVPPVLHGKRVFALDLTLLISGTIYRGEFESRIKQIMEEVAEQDDIILFIDEIHSIIGAGSNQGTMDAANILKPALARGELNCIGATTLDEYQKYITTDPALARRFQSIMVREPSTEEAKQILTGLAKYYESFHEVIISQEAIDTAVDMSVKYIHDNFLPDKAIDLMDEAAASVRVAKVPTELEQQHTALKESWNTLQDEKEHAIDEERFEDAMRIKKKIEILETTITDVSTQLQTAKKDSTNAFPTVSRTHIAQVLATRIGQPVERLLEDEWDLLAALPDRLRTTVIGQDVAINKTVQALKKGFLGISGTKRPIASLLFTGPSGTGKTKLAKELAQALYHDESALVRLDMTEFAEAHGVSKLLGSPAGYVGFNERNKFLDTVRSRPYSVVLFDEFDKAHKDVRKLLLQILDEGTLTDSTGRKISFTHTVVILTSNIGTDTFTKGTFGFAQGLTPAATTESEKKTMIELRESFGAELLGRLTDVCLFTPLTKEHIRIILTGHIEKLSTELSKQRHMQIQADEKAIHELSEKISTTHSGVRTLEQYVDALVQDLIIKKLQQKTRKKIYTLTVNAKGFTLI
jgi:ATP-dependent Clp protease ATP-binding subunit ClpC